jgi:phosphoribosylaminoimidazolecarboxamide formyltransferase / IMP cyclohydrolase
MPRALLSVSDKTGLIPFASELARRGWTLLSTGGTARVLREAGLAVTDVSEVTGHPEIMDGRVKTLHPAVHAGLLGRRGHAGDAGEMRTLGYEAIDMVVVNLYPFEETVARPGVSLQDAIEQIDIGGPSMLRSAAKNHESVWVVCDSSAYASVLEGLDADAAEAKRMRRRLAVEVFARTSAYDRAIASYLRGADGGDAESGKESPLPAAIRLEMERVQPLRYGENPDQPAAFYRDLAASGGLPAARQLHGKSLSYINLLDVDAATLAVSAWADGDLAACAIVKHATPCGLAVGSNLAAAYEKALATDPMSAFGCVVAFSREVDEETAGLMQARFIEAVAAPGFSLAALELLREKKNLRLLELPEEDVAAGALDYRSVRGGVLVQERLSMRFPEEDWRVASRREPSEEEWGDLRFAWRAVASVKSNAILLARGGATLGIGAGQMSRVDASRIAVLKAGDQGHDLRGAALASDAFFPFRDGVDAAAAAGVGAIIQPGGSLRDEEVIAAADEHDIAMVVTGRRLFRH